MNDPGRQLERQPFAGDGILRDTVHGLIQSHQIASVVETGTWLGSTTKALASMVPIVYTIEVDSHSYAQATQNLAAVPNVRQYFGASQNVLPTLLPHVPRPTLYFLDAHWHGSHPLLQELEIIAAADPAPVIVMHDMQVPGHPELQHDPRPDGSPYCYEWVRPVLERLQCPWRHFHNDKAEGCKVGVLFVVPEQGIT
jgi:hypothetical protein